MGLYKVYCEVKTDPRYTIYFGDNKLTPEHFYIYLTEVPAKKLKIYSQFESGTIGCSEMPVVYRWGEIYRASIIKKFYQLQEWYEEEEPHVTFLTMTGRYRPDLEEFFREFFKMREKIMNEFSKLKYDYVWIVEPHMDKDGRKGKNYGYPHLHVLVFAEIGEQREYYLKKRWEIAGIGDFEHGLKFEKPEKIENIKNYVIKDLAKSWIRTDGKYKEDFKWTKELYIFNYIMWKNAYRFWGSSKNLSRIMKYVTEETPIKKECLAVRMLIDENEYELRQRRRCIAGALARPLAHIQ